MDIQQIKAVCNSEYPTEMKEEMILRIIAKDKQAIPHVIAMLHAERETNEEIIKDFNVELSRAHIYIEEREENTQESKQSFNKTFVVDQIAAFYVKYKGKISHAFNRFL